MAVLIEVAVQHLFNIYIGLSLPLVEQETVASSASGGPSNRINKGGGCIMKNEKSTLSVRSVSGLTKARLAYLREYTRLTHASLLDDAIEAIWAEYEAEEHELPVFGSSADI